MGGLGVHPGMNVAVSAIEYVAERAAVEAVYLEGAGIPGKAYTLATEAFEGEFEKSHV